MNSKIIFAGLCLLAISCTKKINLADYNNKSDSPIRFESPLVAPATKAAAEGYTYFNGDHFIVSGVYGNPTLSSFDTSEGHLYMNEVEVAKGTKTIESTTYDTWIANGYFWPKTGKLSFVAYYPKGFKEKLEIGATGVKSNNDNTGYLSFASGNVDFLYSDRVENVSKYGESGAEVVDVVEDPASHRYGVQIAFHHALAKIDFTAKLSTALPAGSTVKINSIQVVGLDYQGKFAQNLANSFTESDGAPAWTYHAGNEEDPNPTTDYSRTVSSPATITATGEEDPQALTLDEELLVLPQSFSDDAEAGIIVNYTVKLGESLFSENITSPKILLKDLTYPEANGKEFKIGKRYVFNMILGFEPIYFNPSVENWLDISVTGGSITL